MYLKTQKLQVMDSLTTWPKHHLFKHPWASIIIDMKILELCSLESL